MIATLFFHMVSCPNPKTVRPLKSLFWFLVDCFRTYMCTLILVIYSCDPKISMYRPPSINSLPSNARPSLPLFFSLRPFTLLPQSFPPARARPKHGRGHIGASPIVHLHRRPCPRARRHIKGQFGVRPRPAFRFLSTYLQSLVPVEGPGDEQARDLGGDGLLQIPANRTGAVLCDVCGAVGNRKSRS